MGRPQRTDKLFSYKARAYLALLILLAASFVFGGPYAQTPAYGLVEAGFLDAVEVGTDAYGLPFGLFFDPVTERVFIGQNWDTGLDVARRRVYRRFRGTCDLRPWSDDFRAFDLDSGAELWNTPVPCGSGVFLTRTGRLLAGTGVLLVHDPIEYDPATGAKLRQIQIDWSRSEPLGYNPILVGFDNTKDMVYWVSQSRNQPYPPLPLTPTVVAKVGLNQAAAVGSSRVMLADACGGTVNPATNTLYIVDEQPGRVVAVDTTNLAEKRSVDIAPYIGLKYRWSFGCRIAVNPNLNRIYLIRMEPQLDFSKFRGGTWWSEQIRGGRAFLVSLDGETLAKLDEVEIANTTAVQSLVVDPRTGKIYVYAPTKDNPRRIQVFSDSSPETLIGDLQTGRYTQWFFAEGTTRPGFRMWLTLYSPDQPNKVRISFLTAQGQPGPFYKEVDLPANTRVTIDVNAEIGQGLDVSTRIVSVWDRPFYVERPIYYSGGEAPSQGGGIGAGVHN